MRRKDGTQTSVVSPLRQVTWERGRLQHQQSFYSFGAMFCALNYISARRFLKYWSSTFPKGLGPGSNRLRLIAHLLREPISVVESVFDYQSRGWEAPLADLDDAISYCRLCITDGFHGRFQTDPLLKRCPIHGVDLCREHFQTGRSAIEGYIERLRQLLQQRNPGWPHSPIDVHYADPCRHPRLAEFILWRASSASAMGGWDAIELALAGMSDAYLSSHLDIWLGRVAWCVPISEQVSDLFLVKPWSQTPAIHACGDEFALEVGDVLGEIGLPSLLWTHKTSQLLWSGTAHYASFLGTEIDMLRRGHERDQCTCIWGKTGNSPWTRFEPGALWSYYSTLCPHRYAAEELRSDWLEVLPAEQRRWRNQVLGHYLSCINLMQDRGIATVVAEVPDRWTRIPLAEFSWSPNVTRLLDAILLALARAQVDELKQWVSDVDEGMPPDSRDHFPPSVFALRTKRGLDSVLVWPAGAGRPIGDQAAESWWAGFARGPNVASGH